MKSLRTYTPDQTEETQGSQENTGIASCFVNYRDCDTALQGKGFIDYDWGIFGMIDGDAPMIEQVLKSFQNNTGYIEKLIGNQLTGTGGTKMLLKLKSLSKNGVARMHGGSNNPIVALSQSPGTRLKVFTFSAALSTGDVFNWAFTTTNNSTGITTAVTPVSVTYATSDILTGGAITTAILANTNVLSAVYNTTSHTMTVTMNPNTFLVSTVLATLTGGAETLVSQTETDTSTVNTAVAAANGAISLQSFGVTTGGGAKIQTCITNGTVDGKPGKPVIRILTGNTIQRYEYVNVSRVIGDVVYLNEALRNLPADLTSIDVVASVDYYPIGLSLPPDIEIQLDFRNHSNKSEYMIYIPRASHDTTTKAPNFTKEGFKGELGIVMLDQLLNVNGVNKLLPYKVKEVYSAVGTN